MPDDTGAAVRVFCAYYFHLRATGCEAVDAILEELAMAGKAFHSTSRWDEEGHIARIQAAADRAAELLAEAREPDTRDEQRHWDDLARRAPRP